jgi:hypothetical protein
MQIQVADLQSVADPSVSRNLSHSTYWNLIGTEMHVLVYFPVIFCSRPLVDTVDNAISGNVNGVWNPEK